VCAWHPKPKRPAAEGFEDMYAASLGSRISQFMPEDVPYPYYDAGDHPTLSRVSDPATRGMEAYLQMPEPIDISPELQVSAANGAVAMDPLVRRILRQGPAKEGGLGDGDERALGDPEEPAEAAADRPGLPESEGGMDESGLPQYDALQDPHYRWMMANKDVGFLPDQLSRKIDDMEDGDEEEQDQEEEQEQQAPPAEEPGVRRQREEDVTPERYKMGRPSAAGWHVNIFPFHGFPAHPPPAAPAAKFPFKHYSSQSVGARKRWNVGGDQVDEPNLMGR